MLRWIGFAVVLGCTGGAERPAERGTRGPPPPPSATARDAAAAPAPVPNGPPLSEVEARALLSERFRNAGFRVLYDVRVTEGEYQLTVDGYDPDKKIGFEYIADSERDTDVSAQERSALRGSRTLLIVDAGPEARVSAAADAFLGALADAGAR